MTVAPCHTSRCSCSGATGGAGLWPDSGVIAPPASASAQPKRKEKNMAFRSRDYCRIARRYRRKSLFLSTIASNMQFRMFSVVALAALLISSAPAQTAKRPINHHDYDPWRAIAGQKFTNDGKFLAYGLFPQEGDGEVVIRNLVTGQGARVSRPECGPRPRRRPLRKKRRKARARRDDRVFVRQPHGGLHDFPVEGGYRTKPRRIRSPRRATA